MGRNALHIVAGLTASLVLSGAATVPMPWAPTAPPVRGLPPGWNQAQLAAFLQTGKRPNGSETRPPMPPYRMNLADARAVSAYIASMK